MNTSRVDGVKAPQHRGTPRSRCWIVPSGHCTACAFFVARRASKPNMYDGR